ncbi:HypC/HybG/HupF family hydrogenase formation chaperone [Gandjariella thermophila]|uniref:Hydrogenase assembly protein HupF n=1 Tax=Gandjariella thermophila TaxID=1931992 RepID=A0A4D4IX37_9PSEU|nr:HypC/HybG/HupF family hydrogenase formation chaperone [Gandjariella thermophila]GDY28761.1 hydrogenase assembly protein HupF [Gandjariella thermophila]
MAGSDRTADCADEVCVTCSDEAVPVRVTRLLDDDLAAVHTGAGEEVVSVALVDARVGDTILVHAKEAIAVLGRSS